MTTATGNLRSMLDILLHRKRSTYGLYIPEEMEASIQSSLLASSSSRKSKSGMKEDCFVPSDLERWELPHYETLFNHFICENGTFKRRVSTVDPEFKGWTLIPNEEDDEDCDVSSDGRGPFKFLQKWLTEIVKSFTQKPGAYELGEDAAVDGLPLDVCEKLRHIHVYF